MADVEVTYQNTKIVELSESGTKTLKTAGKYCEDDIVLEYEKPASAVAADYTVFLFPFQYSIECAAGSGTCTANGPLHWVDWEAVSTDAVALYQNVREWTGLEMLEYAYYCNSITVTTTSDVGNTWSLEMFVDWHRVNDNGLLTISFAGFVFTRSTTTISSFTINGTSVSLDSHTYSPQSHMVFVYNKGVLRIFENGELVDTKTVTLTLNPKSLTITNNYITKQYRNSFAISNLRLTSIALGTEDSYPVPTQLYTGDELCFSDTTDLDPSTSISFYDYDGTLVTQWPLTELQDKTTLPDCPTHTGLTSQGWNWSLADLKTANHACQVGALYIPTDGKTHIFIDLTKGNVAKCTVPLYFNQSVSNGVTIDWGDESATETVSGTGNVSATHVYAENGEYEIAVDVASGCEMQLGWGGSSRAFVAVADTNNANPCVCTKCYLGSGITSIRVDSFRTNIWLKYITIPRGVTSIGNTAFWACFLLKALVLPDGVLTLGNSAFAYCYTLNVISLPNSITSFGSSAFTKCNSLEHVTLYGTLNTYIFKECEGLKSVVIATTGAVKTESFYACRILKKVLIKNGATTIDTSAFHECSSLQEIHIPDSVTGIGIKAFCGCVSLLSVSGCTGVTLIASNAFSYCYLLRELPELTLSSIGDEAFISCHQLTSITLKGTLASQGSKLFYDCGKLSNVTLSNTQTAISANCFNSARCIESLTIPDSITSIGSSAFALCNGLKEVHFKRQTPPSLGNSSTFSNIQPHCVFYVPSGCLSTYTSTTNYPSSSAYTYVEETT